MMEEYNRMAKLKVKLTWHGHARHPLIGRAYHTQVQCNGNDPCTGTGILNGMGH